MGEETMQPCPAYGTLCQYVGLVDELLEACKLAIPTGVCLTNRNVPDSTVIPLDVTMGDLRKIAAAIAKARGQ